MEHQTAEAGETYLNSMGFRSLVEWITAEALLARPEDPLVFIRSILEEKLGERKEGEKYSSEHAMSYIKQCYAAASASADENGRIMIKPRKIVTNVTNTASNAIDPNLVKRLACLEKAIYACRLIAMQLNTQEASAMIIKQACNVMNAERATIFHLDPTRNLLVLQVAEGAVDIKVPFGTGIAGTVAETGKPVNIADAYADPNFDSHYDLRTGYRTKSILCVPIRDGDGKIVGVMQVLNKLGTDKDGGFTALDEEILTILAAQAGVAMNNAQTHSLAIFAREKVRNVLEIVEEMHRNLGFSSLMFTISTRVQRLVNSDRCTLYILDKSKSELWTLQGEVNIRVPLNQGIAGAAAMNNTTINIPNAYADPRFNSDYDQKYGYTTVSVLAMPLRNKDGEVIAVIQLINKLDETAFTSEDEDILSTFLRIAGPMLDNSTSRLPDQARDDSQGNKGNEFTGKPVPTHNASNHEGAAEMNVIKENEEEDA